MTRMAQGKISPKVSYPTALLALAGVALAVLDALGVIDVEDELWLTLLGAAGVTGGVGYQADPGDVVPAVPPYETTYRGDRGFTLLEALVLLLLIAVAVLAYFALK